MLRWIHHLLEPHCLECAEERAAKLICTSCETLKVQLEAANYEKRLLLEQVVELSRPHVPPSEAHIPVNFEEIRPKIVPWRVQRQMLEAEDRKKAEIMRAALKTAEDNKKAADLKRGPSGGVTSNINDDIAKLEREVGIEEEGVS